jgi:hypothetical protein
MSEVPYAGTPEEKAKTPIEGRRWHLVVLAGAVMFIGIGIYKVLATDTQRLLGKSERRRRRRRTDRQQTRRATSVPIVCPMVPRRSLWKGDPALSAALRHRRCGVPIPVRYKPRPHPQHSQPRLRRPDRRRSAAALRERRMSRKRRAAPLKAAAGSITARKPARRQGSALRKLSRTGHRCIQIAVPGLRAQGATATRGSLGHAALGWRGSVRRSQLLLRGRQG